MATQKKAHLVDEKKYHLREMNATKKVLDKQRNIARDKTRADLDGQILRIAKNIKALLHETHDLIEHRKFDQAVKWCRKVVASHDVLGTRVEQKKKLSEMEALPAPDPILRKSRSFKKTKRYKRWSDK